MRITTARRGAASLTLLLAAGLSLTACGDDGGGSASAGGTSPGEGKAECKDLTGFGDLSGKKVRVYTSIVAPEATSQKDSYQLFTDCTGTEIVYEGSKEFEAQLVVRVRSGNPPDIAFVPQPGLLKTLVTDTKKVVAAQAVPPTSQVSGEQLEILGTVGDDACYAARWAPT